MSIRNVHGHHEQPIVTQRDNSLSCQYGKPWDSENSYELQAFGAWLDYEQKRPHQIALVNKVAEPGKD
jgi:hypothetical protein